MGEHDLGKKVFKSLRDMIGGFTLNRKLWSITLMMCICFVVYAVSVNGNAAEAKSLSDIETEKSANQKKQEQKENEMEEIKKQKDAVQAEVDKINANITKTTEDIVNKQKEVAKTQEEIEKLQEEIAELEERIAERDKLLKERVRSMQLNGGTIHYLEVLLGAQSFGDFLDRVLALNTIAEQDRAIIEAQIADKEALEEKKQEVEDKLQSLEDELADLETLKKQLTAQLDEKDELLGKLEVEEEHLHDELGELEDEAELLAAQKEAFLKQEREAKAARERASRGGNTAKATTSSGGGGSYKAPVSSGGLAMPTYGIYQRGFGGSHRGVDISNRSKPPVSAAASGIVTRVVTGCPPRVDSCGGGFGNHVVIAHTINGKRIATLYAHLDKVYVSNGQSVSQGKTIGKMGNTGRVRGATGIHLHFEVHEGGYSGRGSAVDPYKYL